MLLDASSRTSAVPRISVGNRSTDSTSSAHHAPAEMEPNRQANIRTPSEPLIAKMPKIETPDKTIDDMSVFFRPNRSTEYLNVNRTICHHKSAP